MKVCALLALPVLSAFPSAFAGEKLPMTMEETLIELRPDYRPAWTEWKDRPFELGDDSLVLRGREKKGVSVSHARQMMRSHRTYFPAYCASGRAKVSFEYRCNVKGARNSFDYWPMLRGKGNACYVGTNLAVAADWTPAVWYVTVPPCECYAGDFWFSLPPGTNGLLEIRRLRVTEVPPEKGRARPLLANGTRLTEIALLRTADELTMRNERRAAQIVRYALYRNGYEYLPIREYVAANGRECPFSRKGRILIGRAAEGTGFFGNDFFSDGELETIRTKLGTGAYSVRGGAVGITGNCPGGPQFGAYLFIKSLGLEYIATDVWHAEPHAEAEGHVVKVPAIPYRSYFPRWGMHGELRGMLSCEEITADLAAGSPIYCSGSLSHDSLGYIVPMTEFEKTHPDFFALQSDGTRMDAKRFHLGHTQFCWSNPELKKVVIERYLGIMRASPGVRYFCFAPGDGAGRDCKCENCKKRGDNSTALVELMNEIGAAIGKEFPNNAIYTYSYATTLAAPKVDHVDPHVKFTDSIYMPSHWPASEWWDHPSNRRGMEELAKWRRVSPDMGVMGYYESCGQVTHVWPAIPGWIAMHRDFARHGAWYVDRTYGNVAHAQCIGNTSACGDMAWYVIPQVEIDPDVDDAALKARHMKLFFGPAADAMTRYLARLEKELVDRDWVENCEWPRRGFITPQNAEEFMALLDEAMKAAKDGGEGASPYLHRVKRERQIFLLTYLKDVNRGRGNVTSADYPRWAKRVAEFITLTRETNQYYFGYMDQYSWFRDALLYKLENTRGFWLSETKQLDRIVADPEKELGGVIPNVQEKTKTGVKIPLKGLQGGERQPKCVWRVRESKCPFADPKTASLPAVLVPRESSGKGVVLSSLRLEKAPTNDVKMVVRGIDGPTDGPAKFEFKVNGTVVKSGDVPWKKTAWSETVWTIPAKLLKVGSNDLSIRNATPDFEKDGDCGAAFAAKRNHFRGWFLISEQNFEF